ncbi:MAG: PQQ-binding-like beta-propeller repeat protein [Planctomycetes bacterium]|nr:PQQ-binding-like beta-propeller repeat protein [Planctomycetota bacterium]
MSDCVYIGFNRRVACLDRRTGEQVWSWKAPKGSGYVSLLLDGDTLFAVVNGYVYALDPAHGRELWSNAMPGFGFGVACIATDRAHTDFSLLAQSLVAQQQAAASASASS